MDGVLIAVSSGLAGVSVSVLGGLIGAWLQARREHRRWLREQRYIAFLEMERLIEEIIDFRADKQDSHRGTARRLVAQLTGQDEHAVEIQRVLNIADDLDARRLSVFTKLRLLGPRSIASRLDKVASTLGSADERELQDARTDLMLAMQKALSIND